MASATMIDVDLKGWRKALGLEGQEAAAAAGVATRTWWRWESQGRVPDIRLLQVAQALGVEAERLHGPPPGPLERGVAELVAEHGAGAVEEAVRVFVNDGTSALK